MKTYQFYSKNSQKSVIALGFFDAVHVGHQKVLKTCTHLAQKLNAQSTVFTFMDNLSAVGKDGKLLTTFDERITMFEDIGIQATLTAPCNNQFFSLSPISFLDKLKDDFNAIGIVCGEDFTFGAGGVGNVEFLKAYCKNNDICLEIVDVLKIDGKKIGARDVKTLILEGRVSVANQLLGYNYSLKGFVVKGRGDGKKFVVPTINVNYPLDKVIPKNGVYVTRVTIGKDSYLGITNVGAHPTFLDEATNIETYLIDVDFNFYDKEVKIEFLEYVRDIVKFDTSEELRLQIQKDVEVARRL